MISQSLALAPSSGEGVIPRTYETAPSSDVMLINIFYAYERNYLCRMIQGHSYQPSRFLLEYPEKTHLIPLSRICTSNSHILGRALARPAQPIAIATGRVLQYTPRRNITQAHCDVLRVFVIFPLTTPEKGVLKFIARFVGQPQRHLQQAY